MTKKNLFVLHFAPGRLFGRCCLARSLVSHWQLVAYVDVTATELIRKMWWKTLWSCVSLQCEGSLCHFDSVYKHRLFFVMSQRSLIFLLLTFLMLSADAFVYCTSIVFSLHNWKGRRRRFDFHFEILHLFLTLRNWTDLNWNYFFFFKHLQVLRNIYKKVL